ncbi:hypothetical protein A11A3_05539 [Alcanivorax hongdengensis A-11-3]|uniref:DUF368 domain-containing protein n=1 Tax=Alcanivorax hongdengensis A-11-3 TaxID=1177179 RepID=L0WH13_9GAMM|nr:DUF368 domain-containing protein [Alcanivorax hongdengensis]EKF75130.1 hypothetical protein A11A3_05539 [Alcanivorax hongdengensis A-11-3]
MIRLGVYFRGMSMGAADLVPGVSGGTMALITGVYEELIDTLGGLGPHLLGVWRREGLVAAWRAANLTFLVTLLAGIFTSVALLSHLITWLLDDHPVPVWAFFSGLILASIALVLAPLRQRGLAQWLALLVGIGAALAIALAPGIDTVDAPVWVFFASGALAICAMILPGISGSFILLLLGMYQPILEAVNAGRYLHILAFLAGCATGLLSFVHLLKWLLHHYHDTLMALLAGFMGGSLLVLWPWREAGEHGQRGDWLTPGQYAHLTGLPAQVWLAALMVAVGVLAVWLLYRAAPVHNVAQQSSP